MEIGKTKRVIEIVPVEEPRGKPRQTPIEIPSPPAVAPERKPVKVPA